MDCQTDNSDEKSPLLDETWCESETQLKNLNTPNRCDETFSSYSTLVPADLPPSKKYHLFISNCSEDDERVKELVKVLENEYAIKCMFAHRNFVGGVPTEENIDLRMKESMKVLAIVTPSYIESGWCGVESRVAVGEGITVIPVMYEACKLPSTLKGITYIDATRGDEIDVPAKIAEAYFYNNSYEELQGNNSEVEELEQHQKNGRNIFRLTAIDVSKKYALSKKWEFQELGEYEESILAEADVSQARYFITCLIRNLNNESLLQYYGVLFKVKNLLLFWLMFCCVISLAEVALLFLITLIRKTDDIPGTIYLACIMPSSILSCFILPCVRNRLRRKFVVKAILCVRKIVKRFYKETKTLVFFTTVCPPTLHVRRYDTEPCMNFLKDLIMEQNEELKEEDAQEEADSLIERTIFSLRFRLASWILLPDSPSERHRTHGNKLCLCQMIEQSMESTKGCGFLDKADDKEPGLSLMFMETARRPFIGYRFKSIYVIMFKLVYAFSVAFFDLQSNLSFR